MIQKLSQLEKELETKDESKKYSDNRDDNVACDSEDAFNRKEVPSHGYSQSDCFKCNMCDYVCEKVVTLSKHKNTEHQNTNIKESAYLKENDKMKGSNQHDNNKVMLTDNSLVLTLPRVVLDDGELAIRNEFAGIPFGDAKNCGRQLVQQNETRY